MRPPTRHADEWSNLLVVVNTSGRTDKDHLVTKSRTIFEVTLPVSKDLIHGNGRKGTGRACVTKQMGLKRPAQIDGPQLCRRAQGQGGRRGPHCFLGQNATSQLFQSGLVSGSSNYAIEVPPENDVANPGMFRRRVGKEGSRWDAPDQGLLPGADRFRFEIHAEDDLVGKPSQHVLERFIAEAWGLESNVKNYGSGSRGQQAVAEKRKYFARPD